jgi:hypothetical protein
MLGLTTVSGQILTPLAGDLADDAHRGRVVGTVGAITAQRAGRLHDRSWSLPATGADALWSVGGWTAVTLTGAALSCFGLTVWAVGRRGPLVVAKPH